MDTMNKQLEQYFSERVLPRIGQLEAWRPNLIAHLEFLETASPDEWSSEAFLQKLWASEAVSDTKLGSISVDTALSDSAFREWFSSAALEVRRLDGTAEIGALKSLLDELLRRFKEFGLPRIPRLKAHRVLAALAPAQLTTLANPGTREQMFRWITGKSHRGVHSIDQQVAIRKAFDELVALHPEIPNPQPLTAFMLPWVAFKSLSEDKKVAALKVAEGSQATPPDLSERPAPTKNFASVGGGIQRLLEICDMLADAPLSEEDFIETLQERYPWNYAWSKSVANFLTVGVGILTRDNTTYQLSALGHELLEKRNGQVLAERLIGTFVGVDHVLVTLKDGPQRRDDLVSLLRRVNTGWTTNFAPNTALSWLVFLGAICLDKGEYSLTESGYNWVSIVRWTPQKVSQATVDIAVDEFETTATETELPDWRKISTEFALNAGSSNMSFDMNKVFHLHTGLWKNDVRHFCILSGLSGAGKTQMALRYARAVAAAAGEDDTCIAVVPVQPDWADPSHLIGFRHPLDPSRYQTTQFLDLLLRAHNNPTKPHFAILDEMNLAHPELYLANVLSAMETEGELWLHQSKEQPLQQVPYSVRYPRNLAIIGTINMDETTHALSDKVLDRADVIEYSAVDLDAFHWSQYDHLGHRLPQIREVLGALGNALFPVRLHFAFRVVKSILDHVSFSVQQSQQGDDADWLSSFDFAISSKILPKLRGEDSKEMRDALNSVLATLEAARLVVSANRMQVLRTELSRDGVLKYWR
ncbi:McrB family protein (plasmid) [Paraburkholderia strydomiana]